LLISLFIYLFYRTSNTVVNEIIIQMISPGTYTNLKTYIIKVLPLSSVIIYSLPEGLWIFCITITSKPYYIRLNNWRFDCVVFPLIFCLALEIFQLAHITNGRFDYMDIWVSILFWTLGKYGLRDENEKQEIFTRPSIKMLICLVSYGIVYLAHVK
jgi:hypothetical protein